MLIHMRLFAEDRLAVNGSTHSSALLHFNEVTMNAKGIIGV